MSLSYISFVVVHLSATIHFTVSVKIFGQHISFTSYSIQNAYRHLLVIQVIWYAVFRGLTNIRVFPAF